MLGVVQDRLAQHTQPLVEVVDLRTQLVELREQLLGLALLLQARVGDRLAARHQQAHLGVQDLLLGGLVYRQEAYQLLERLPPGLAAALFHLGEQSPDLGVLVKQHRDHVGLARLTHRFHPCDLIVECCWIPSSPGAKRGAEPAGISSPPGTPVRPGWRSTRGSRFSIGSCSGWAGRLGGGGGWRCLGQPLRLPDELAEPFDGPLVGAEVIALQGLLGAPVLFGLLLEDPRQRR
jgi:hypothetical protein